MTIIREEVFHFVKVWNRHSIRRQSNQPGLPTGRPCMLYNYPKSDAESFGQIPNPIILQQLSQDVAEYGT